MSGISKSKTKKQKLYNQALGGLWIGTLLALLALLTICIGCAAFKRPIIHPLSEDFMLLNKGESFVAPKQGAFVSDYFMQEVMSADVK